MPALDTSNRFLVCAAGDRLAMIAPPTPGQRFDADTALTLAAWLLVMAEGVAPFDRDIDDRFARIVKGIRNT